MIKNTKSLSNHICCLGHTGSPCDCECHNTAKSIMIFNSVLIQNIGDVD